MLTSAASLQTRGLELLMAYAKNPSLELRNQLVRLNLGLVRKVAHQMREQCNEPYEDLEQTGYLGLIRAIERFDIQQGYAFSSFALPYIRGAMLHYLRDKANTVRIPRRWQELYSRGRKQQKQLTACLGHTPSDHELAQSLGVSLEEWRDCKAAAKQCNLVSLDAHLTASSESPLTLADILPDGDEFSRRQQQEDRINIQSALSQLDHKEKLAIELVFLQEYSRREAAQAIGISPMTVTRYVNKGMKHLESLLTPSQVAC
ncbi:sigma-70 family RNA polymerase sigma factor [Spirulina subsalsa]|uniref:sigma-70 family RNA polymerase sigma factor n=1 Tax=Spirulina subsalsa TaxID=54311 RepID=UPI0004749FE0|nr:sigma-70 family RNA polymerase sigma factor [Spirulina subsalsa]